jgi:hypothetical protein
MKAGRRKGRMLSNATVSRGWRDAQRPASPAAAGVTRSTRRDRSSHVTSDTER